ncbi:MAG: hypothetical protein OIN66_12440 [Candidatus Methanoperedens sp.]|nr:hypothetical protein [Candidatus Methanoperedens sp.]
MIKKVLIIATVLLLAASGCVTPTPTPVTTPTHAPTETPSLTPTATPTATSTPLITTSPASVKPIIKVTSYPTTVNGESNFTIKWEVSGGSPGNISHTAVHWGFNSGGENISDYPRTSIIQTGKTPQQFSVELKAPASGTIYFRAHAIVDGTNVYAPEYTITINPRYTGGGGGY